MKRKTCTWSMIVYETKNIMGNPFILFFSIVFPLFMLYMISTVYTRELAPEAARETVNGMFITMSMVIPMSILLIGYGANYSEELEKGIPLRMHLFGFTQAGMMTVKMIAHALFLTAALLIYTVGSVLLVGVQAPAPEAALIVTGTLYALAAVFFMIAHAVATWVKKFSLTFGITMLLYFAILFFCGMMGVQVDMLPSGMEKIAGMLPMSYVSRDFVSFWRGGSYNFGPFLQALLFLGALAGILCFLSLRREKRRLI